MLLDEAIMVERLLAFAALLTHYAVLVIRFMGPTTLLLHTMTVIIRALEPCMPRGVFPFSRFPRRRDGHKLMLFKKPLKLLKRKWNVWKGAGERLWSGMQLVSLFHAVLVQRIGILQQAYLYFRQEGKGVPQRKRCCGCCVGSS